MARFGACSLMLLMVGVSCGGRSSLLASLLGDGAVSDDRRDRALLRDSILDPRCPQLYPEIGDTCSTPQLRCNYERCLTEGKSDLTYLCLETGFFWEGRWDCAPNPPGCPSQPPADLSPCSLPDAICRWAPGSKAHCRASDNHWHLFAGI